jgi:hypothetical protein
VTHAESATAAIDFEQCPLCWEPLSPRRSRFGQVRVCARCMGGTTTLPVLKRVAPREFIQHLWQAAQRSGRSSFKSCPSCRQPLLSLGPEVEIEPEFDVCVRCYVVWFEQATLEQLVLAGHAGFGEVAVVLLDALAERRID